MVAKKSNKLETIAEEKQILNPPAMAMTTALTKAKSSKEDMNSRPAKMKEMNNSSKIIVKCDCGFSNNLFIRGEGIATLNWKKGIPLKNLKKDEWVFETDRPFVQAEFKILINDQKYEIGENHKLDSGSTVVCKPLFQA